MIETIGILGFGVVGKAALAFIKRYEKELFAHLYGDFYGHASSLQEGKLIPFVWDEKMPTEEGEQLLRSCNASFVLAGNMSMQAFFALHDYVIVSPGINLNAIPLHEAQVLCELDLFSIFFKKPTIAITGTLGKTTITKLLSHFLSSDILQEESLFTSSDGYAEVLEGGNVGVGMLDLIDSTIDLSGAVLELSSFQLERSKLYAPDIAILTNLFDNHLDRHETLEKYSAAKWRLFAYQCEGQVAIMPMSCYAPAYVKAYLCLTSTHGLDEVLIKSINRDHFSYITIDQGDVCLFEIKKTEVMKRTVLVTTSVLPDITFLENWLLILAALYFSKVDFVALSAVLQQALKLYDHHHRMEHCATINRVDFYNDSKSTVIQATEAAVKKLAQNKRPILLILGGIGKGVDRSPLMTALASIQQLKKVYCFGKSCSDFQGCQTYDSLEAVLGVVFNEMQPGDQVLFSPSGASYDLFEHYKQRGDVFKKLVSERNK